MARKTIEVEKLKAYVNQRLASNLPTADERRELSYLLAHFLHETGNYLGFSYLPSEYAEEPPFAPNTTQLRPGYDDTRRKYH